MRKSKLAFKALDNISLSIEDNKFVCIVGETGSGKSTLIQHFNALLLPDEGCIKINDYIIDKKGNKKLKELRQEVGLVFQFPEAQLFEETVIKDVCFGLLNFGYKQEEALARAEESLSMLGIKEDKYERSPFELSGGERRRVALAGVLAIKPKYLILDEPTVGLDPNGCLELYKLLNVLKDNGTTIIAVTHDMDFVFSLAEQVIVLEKGHITFNGSRDNFFKQDIVKEFELPDILVLINTLNKYGKHISISDVRDISDIVRIIKDE